MALVLTYQVIIWSLVRSLGFVAISDDDYARVVIARGFSQAPSLDPSGTSWLPFPFWTTGAFMWLPLSDLAAARLGALFNSLLSAVLLHRSAQQVGLSRRASLLSTFFALSLPYSAYLGAATVPEHLTAALIVFGASTLARTEHRLRLLGAFAFTIACASRYEAWPAAFAFAFLNCWKPSSPSRGYLAVAAPSFIVVLFPLLWLAHGYVNHGHALFFVKRVVSYKEALGDPLPDLGALIQGFPSALLLAEPEVSFPLIGAGILLLLRPRARSSQLFLPWIVLGSVLIALLVGAARGGAPTHHSERVLLSLWFFAPISVGFVATNLAESEKRRAHIAFIGLALLGTICRQLGTFERSPFGNRVEEETLGKFLGARRRDRPVGLLAPDYGYFAIQAASDGAPTVLLRSQDPRQLNSEEEPIAAFVRAGGCEIIVPKSQRIDNEKTLLETPRLKLLTVCR